VFRRKNGRMIKLSLVVKKHRHAADLDDIRKSGSKLKSHVFVNRRVGKMNRDEPKMVCL